MHDLFASMYEYIVYDPVFSIQLFQSKFYLPFGLLAILIPLGFMAAFYLFIKYPWCKWWHWGLILLTSLILVGIFSYNMLAKELAVYIFDPENYPDVNAFLYKLLIVNVIYGLSFGVLGTFIFKQFPLPQRHLPWGSN